MGLLVWADMAVRRAAESQLRHRVVAAVALRGPTTAHIESFPFLGRLLTSGTVSHIRITAAEVTAERLTFAVVSLDLDDVTFDRGRLMSERTVVLKSLGRGTAVADVTQERLSEVLGVAVTLEAGRVRVRVGNQSVTARASVSDNTLRVTVAGLSVPTLPIPRLGLLPCAADVEVLAGRIRLTCRVDQLPAELVGRPLAAQSVGRPLAA